MKKMVTIAALAGMCVFGLSPAEAGHRGSSPRHVQASHFGRSPRHVQAGVRRCRPRRRVFMCFCHGGFRHPYCHCRWVNKCIS